MKDITIVATVFNDSRNIIKYLDNIIYQTEHPKEIIITDGGSTDDTINLIEEYAKTSPIEIKVFHGERLNIAQGFNKAIRNVSTDYVIITCTGNLFPQTMVFNLFKWIDNSKADIVYGILKGQNNGDFSQYYNETFIGGERGILSLSNRCVILRKDVFDRVGYFKEDFIYAGEDTEFFYRTKTAKLNHSFINETVVYWETPNLWKEYLKQLKFYSIASLQWDRTISRNFNKSNLFIALLIFLLISSPFYIYSLLFFILLLITSVISIMVQKKISLRAAFLYSSRSWIKLYYKIKYIKYAKKKYRVV